MFSFYAIAHYFLFFFFFFFQAEDGIRDGHVTGVQTCALPILRSAVVSVGILRFVPQTDCERFLAALPNERDFVLESLLFSKQREDVLLQPLGKLRNTIGLQMYINSACKHDTLLGSQCQGGDSDNHYWFR